MSHSDANELHLKGKTSARQAVSSTNMKNKSSLFVSFHSLKGWLTLVVLRPNPMCLLPALARDLRASSQLLITPDTPLLRGTSEGTNQHPARSLKDNMTKTAKKALLPYLTKVTGMELLWMKERRTFIFGSLWVTVSLPFKSEESEAKPKQNKSTGA